MLTPKRLGMMAAAALSLVVGAAAWAQTQPSTSPAPAASPSKPESPKKAGVPATDSSDRAPASAPSATPTATPSAVPPVPASTQIHQDGTLPNPVMKGPGIDPPTLTNAEITFEMMNHDFGRVASGKPAIAEFKFKNTGTEKLVIQQVRTSCGCTAAALDVKEFEPGQGDTIKVTFNPKGKGPQAKTITVVHNGKNGPDTMLNIKSDVFEVVEATPSALQLGEMVRGQPRTERVVLLSDDKSLQIKSIDVNGEKVTAVQSPNPPSDNTDPRPGKLAVDITFDGDLPVGRFLRVITIKALASPTPGAPQEEWDLKINAFANIVGDLKADPPSIRVPTTNPNEAFGQEVFISRRSGSPFTITSAMPVNANLPGLEVKYEPAEQNGVKGYKLIFSGNTGPAAGIIRGNVLVKTDVADEPEFRISFTGMVRDPNAPKAPAPAAPTPVTPTTPAPTTAPKAPEPATKPH